MIMNSWTCGSSTGVEIYFNFNEEGSAIFFKELLAGRVINRLPEALANWLISSVQGLIIFADKSENFI